MSDREKVITSIEVQKRNKNRVNIYIDGNFSFSCSAELVYTHGLKSGKTVVIQQLGEIVNEDNYLKCKNDSLKIIEKSYKSEKEVFDKLTNRGYDERTVAKTIEFLRNYNFLSDENFTELYIKDKIKTHGKNKIKYSLLRKGIDENIILQALNKVDSLIEQQTALAMAEKKYKILVKSENDKRKVFGKLWEHLSRNGFNKELIEEVINKVVVFNEHDNSNDINEPDLSDLYEIAEKRYKIIVKSENDERKINKKLADYLLRRGYSWDNIKSVLKQIANIDELT
jgi:regulatory protein